MSKNFVIRQAKINESKHIVPLIFAAGEEALTWVYGGSEERALDFLKHCFVQNNTPFSYNFIQVVEVDGELAGVFSVGTIEHAKSMGGPLVAEMFRYFGFSFGAWTYFKAAKLERSLPVPKDGCLYLSNVSIKDDYKRQGILRFIVDTIDRHAYERELDYIAIDVSKENRIAIAAYNALGFNFQYSRPAPKKNVPGYEYYTKRVAEYDLD